MTYTESEREHNRELTALLQGEGLTSCFKVNARILARRKREFVDVTTDCDDENRQAILAINVLPAKLRYCHECEVYHAK